MFKKRYFKKISVKWTDQQARTWRGRGRCPSWHAVWRRSRGRAEVWRWGCRRAPDQPIRSCGFAAAGPAASTSGATSTLRTNIPRVHLQLLVLVSSCLELVNKLMCSDRSEMNTSEVSVEIVRVGVVFGARRIPRALDLQFELERVLGRTFCVAYNAAEKKETLT